MLSPVNIDDIHNILSIRHSKWDTGLGVTQAAAESGAREGISLFPSRLDYSLRCLILALQHQQWQPDANQGADARISVYFAVCFVRLLELGME